MKAILFAVALVVFALAVASGQTPSMSWDDSTRDVYIDGQIDRQAQVLVPEDDNLMVMISSRLKQAVLLNSSAGTVDVVDKDAFKFSADRSTASSPEKLSSKTVGKFTKISNVYSFIVEGKPILINRHEGALGEITEEKLWETVPVWHSLMENYSPSADAVSGLKTIDKNTQLTVILGTWCHDSKNQVPRLLKAVETANNKNLHVKLIALDHGFTKSIATLEHYQVTNTPTIIVQQNGHEIGRINETPAVPLIEDDLVAILRGKPNIHHGSSDHGPQLAQGAYQYLDRDGKETGREKWELYITTNNGRFLHSSITRGDLRTEIYYETDPKRYPVFIEITVYQGDRITRARYNIEDHKLTAHMTGNAGVSDQTTSFPLRSAFSSPAIAGEEWGWVAATEAKSDAPVMTYFALSGIDSPGGFVDNVAYESKGEQTIHVPAGEFRVVPVVQKTKTESREWYASAQLGIPIKGEMKDGGTFVLTSLETAPAGK